MWSVPFLIVARSMSQSTFFKAEESLRVQSLFMTGVRVLRAILTIGIPIVLVRVLPQETFGVYKQVGLISTAVLALLSLSLPASLFYFVPRLPARSQVFVVQTAAVFVVTSAVGGLVVAFNDAMLARFFGPNLAEYSVWLGIIIGLSVTSMLDALMVVDRRVKLAAVSSASLDAAHGLLIVGTAIITRDLHAILAVVSISLILRVIVLLVYIRWRGTVHPPSNWNWSLAEQFQYALPYYVASLIAMSRDQLHAFFVAANYSAAEYAIYAIGTIQLPLVGHMMQSVGETIVLENSKNYAERNLSEMRRVWHRATYIVAMVVLPLFFVLEFFADDIITVVFGTAYADSASVWRVFVIMLPMAMFLGATMLRATGDLKRMIIADLISLAITVTALVALVDMLGILAAVWSIVLGHAALSCVVIGRVMHRLELRLSEYLQWRKISAVAIVALLCVTVAYYVTLPFPAWLRITLGPAIAGMAYLASIWVTQLIPNPERQALIQLRRRLLRR